VIKILLIEDEAQIARFIQLELIHEGYHVDVAYDGRDGLGMFKAHPFDLVLLDIMLPSINGFEVLRRIRQRSAVPVIMLTARDEVVDKVSGLDAGADDYITKPFAIEELLARIRKALKHNTQTLLGRLTHQNLTLDLDSRTCTVCNQIIELTKKEYDLLQMLLENRNRVLSRDLLLEKIWGYEFDGTTNAVDVYVRYLRAKIEEPFDLRIIQTVRSIGYVIKDA
jgi:two-component system, OmpR family, response regulator ArlR